MAAAVTFGCLSRSQSVKVYLTVGPAAIMIRVTQAGVISEPESYQHTVTLARLRVPSESRVISPLPGPPGRVRLAGRARRPRGSRVTTRITAWRS